MSQRPNESDAEYERRIQRRHEQLVKPFRSMEVHEATARRKNLKEEEVMASKAAVQDKVLRKERERVVAGLDAKEFSFAVKDRERQDKKEADLEQTRKQRKDANRSLQFKARPVKLYFTENWEDIEKRQDAERKQRVASRAASLQSTSQLPARMAMHDALRRQDGHVEKESAADRTRRKLAGKEAKLGLAHAAKKIDGDRYTQTMAAKQKAWESKLAASRESVRAHATVPNRELPIERRQREHEEKRRER